MNNVNLIDQLQKYVKEIGLDLYKNKEQLYRIYSSVAKCDYETAKRIISGTAEPFRLDYEQYWDIIHKTVNKQIEMYPQEKETLSNKLNESENRIKFLCLKIYFPYLPSFSDPLSDKERIDSVNNAKTYFYLLSPQKAYILSHNLQAFLRFQEINFASFYTSISTLSSEAIRKFEKFIDDLQMIISSKQVVDKVCDLSLQQWLRIQRGFYKKTVNSELKNNAKIIQRQQIKWENHVLEIHQKDPDKESSEDFIKYIIKLYKKSEYDSYFMEEAMLAKCWKKFSNELKNTPFCLGTPSQIITMTKILDNISTIDLLIRFLCCDSKGQDLLLSKAKGLAELEKSTTQQTTN